MEIDSKKIIKILNKNFGFKIVETPFGEAVEMNAREAFIYSSVTGAGYLDNPIYPFTPKGLVKLFYNAFDYKFVSGFFDNGVLKNTPRKLIEAKPFLGTGTKFIVPIDFNSEVNLTKKLQEIYSNIDNPTDYVIQRVETSKKGNGLEPFVEYLAAEYFRKKGYIVENQVPLAHSLGSPDFAGYGLSDYLEKINSSNFLSSTGFHIIELSMISSFGHEVSVSSCDEGGDFIVGEAKTSTTQMAKQIDKYLKTGLFSKGFEMHPSKPKSTRENLGLIRLNSDLMIEVKNPIGVISEGDIYSRKDYKIWLENYIKFYLIGNLSNDELGMYYKKTTGLNLNGPEDLVSFISQLKIEKLLSEITPK